MQDLRDAFRALKSTPVVTAIAVLSLALGIGANTAIFSILDTLLLRSLPVRDPARLAIVGDNHEAREWTNPIWEQIREHRQLFDGAFVWSGDRFDLAPAGQTEYVDGLWASGGIFDVLGVQPILGRTFTDADDRRGGGPDGPVTVISYNFWQRRFNGAADAVGRTLTVEHVPFTIVGVTPPDFFGVDVGRRFDVAIPLGTEPLIRGKESRLDERSFWWLDAMVRLEPDQTLAAGEAALRGVVPQMRAATMPNWRPEDQADYLRNGFTLIPAATGGSGLRERYQLPLTAIMVVVALVLLIACANIANLLLARATSRRHELSVRAALGASRMRIARQLLAESLLLSAAGAGLGLLFAQWGSELLVRQLSTTTNHVFLDLAINWKILAFTAAVAVGTAILFGIAPALRGTRVQPNDVLKSQGRGVAGETRSGFGNTLVVVQVALSLVLVVAAGLFVRTFASLAHRNLGFDRNGVLVAAMDVQRAQLDPDQRPALFTRLLDAASSVPGVSIAALSEITPISGSSWNNRIELPDDPLLPERERSSYINVVSERWFQAYRTSVIAGRNFTRADSASSAPVAIVNEAFVRAFLGSRNPIGTRIRQPGGPDAPAVDRLVVGVVEDAVYRSVRAAVPPTMYLPFAQRHESPTDMSISVRPVAGSPMLLAKSLASALTSVRGDVAITFRPLEDQVNAAMTQERVVAILSGFFGVLALLLAGLGLYGVTSYGVSRRRTELGIRMALGADPGGVIALVLRRVAILVGIGVLVGTGASLWAARLIQSLLYGLQPQDPTTLVAASAVLAGIGAIAGWLPARRASRIDPAQVLREG
jgi:predicted permease